MIIYLLIIYLLMSSINNILSYFIKDIKEPINRAFYKQTNYDNGLIVIYYKNESIFKLYRKYVYKYIINITYSIAGNIRCNYKIASYSGYKYLYYKHDNNIKFNNYNKIAFHFIHKKYMLKGYFEYIIDKLLFLSTIIKYYNGYKYLSKQYKSKQRYTINQYNICINTILIMNKYELYYYNMFFNLYFVINGSKRIFKT
jgi:hypothetical protein